MKQKNEQQPFMTKLGRLGVGVTKNDTLRQAIPLIHDMLAHAVMESLDLFIVCRGLNALKDSLFRGATGNGYVDLLKRVMDAGSNVAVLLWTTDTRAVCTPEILDLHHHANRSKGKFDARISGSDDHRFGHFIVAMNSEKDRWLVRLERPHKPIQNNLDFPVPAAVLFGTAMAKTYAEQVLRQFSFYFGASKLIPSQYLMNPSWKQIRGLETGFTADKECPEQVVCFEPASGSSDHTH